MKKNSSLKLVLAIIGGVVVLGSLVVAVVHFWDDLKKLCPCCKCKDDAENLEEPEAPEEDLSDFEDIAE